MFSYQPSQFEAIVDDALAQARAVGATDAAIDVSESAGLSVGVRRGRIETIEQTRDKGLGVTVYLGQRRGHASSSDFSAQAVQQAVRAAYDIARFTAEDAFAGLPEPELLFRGAPPDLDLFHPWSIDTEAAVELALRMERAAFDTSPMIRNSEGASVSVHHGQFFAANSRGFRGGHPYSRHTVGCVPIARRGRSMQRDDWFSSDRSPARLADPQRLGRYAAERALSRLGARQLATGRMPVLFEAPLACGLLGHFTQAASGGALYRRSSFLLDALGEPVFAPHVDVTEEPHLPGESGSAAFDDEGVATRRREVVAGGTLQGYFLSCYSARKLGMQTTANAGGAHNLVLSSRQTQPGDDLPAMLRKLDRGLFVTELLGQGVNYVTGDYSRGATGFWVENGQIQYPVEEITIAGNLRQMLRDVAAVGADTLVRGGKRTGSILVAEMAVAGS